MGALSALWTDIGVVRWPLAWSLVAVAILSAWALVHLRSGPPGRPETKAWIDAVLFWGAFAFLAGLFGSLVGIVQVAQVLEVQGGAVAPALMWGGIKVTMLSTVLGAMILAGAALSWFALQLNWRLTAGSAQGATPA